MSKDRLRGLRIFDITDIANPKNVGNVQTCRGSHTHTVLVDPKDTENVYVYISGSSGVRSPKELRAASTRRSDKDPNSALFRIEVIKIPLAHPEQAAIVSSPRIFTRISTRRRATARRRPTRRERTRAFAAARARRLTSPTIRGDGAGDCRRRLRAGRCSTASSRSRGGTGAPTAADSAALRAALPRRSSTRTLGRCARQRGGSAAPGPTQCHDITVYPAIGLAGGACAGYGLLLDISDPANPRRIGAVADSNFSFWHSATFSNDGTKVLFSDEWGGGGAAELPRDGPARVGRGRDLHDRERQDGVPELLQASRRRRRRSRTASRTTAR